MKLDPDKFKEDENKSNPMVVAMSYPDCPINEICAYVVVVFGTIAKQCEYFKSDAKEEKAECLKGSKEK